MPRLWNDTIEKHRRDVRDAIVNAAAALVDEYGPRSVTMSLVARKAGIGRATLYKYFQDIEAILIAWHQARVADHLGSLVEARDRAQGANERLRAVLRSYALIAWQTHGHHDAELTAFLHRTEHVAHARRQLGGIIRDLLAEGAQTGEIRADVPPEELANYCLHALAAAEGLPGKTAVERLVAVTLDALAPRS